MKRILVLLASLAVAQAVMAADAGLLRSQQETAQVRTAFSPQDDVAGMIIASIGQAQRQVLVQAFSFTHEDIARALITAHQRGVDVRVIADQEQTEHMKRGQIFRMARAGVAVWLDGEHQSAHNKVMVIDAGGRNALVITGSYNFTYAAQHKNAENVVFLGGNDKLAASYAANWQQHLAHSSRLVLH